MFGLDFLKNLGSRVGQGVKKFGEMDDDGAAPRTPPFLPEGGGVKPQLPISRPEMPARPNLPIAPPAENAVMTLPRSTAAPSRPVENAVMTLPRSAVVPSRPVENAVMTLPGPITTPSLPPYGVKPPMAPPKAIPSAEEIGGNPSPTMGIIPRPALPPVSMPSNVQPGNAAEVLDRRGVPLPALPGQRNPTPYSDINRERYDYNTAHMKRDENGDLTSKYKRDWKQVLGNMLMGAAQGAQSVGPHGNALGGLIGGAGVGLGGSVASPQGSTNYAFDTRHLPEIERQQAEAAAERQQEMARVKAEQDALMGRAKLGQVLAGTEHTQAQTDALRNPADQYGATGWGTYNKRTGEVGYEKPAGTATPYKPQGLINTQYGIFDPASRQWVEKFDKAPTEQDALGRVIAQDGSVESIAQDSLRGRLDSLRQRLSPEERNYLEKGAPSKDELLGQLSPGQRAIVTGTGTGTPAEEAAAFKAWRDLQGGAAASVAKAQTAWDRLQKSEYDRILKETQGEAKRKAAEIRTGKAPAPPSGKSSATATSPSGGGKIFPASRLNAFAQTKGMSPEQARAYVQQQGYEVR